MTNRGAAAELSPLPGGDRDERIDRATQVFLRLAIGAVMIASIASIFVNFVFVPAPGERIVFPVATLTIVAISGWMLRIKRYRESMVVLSLGTWLAATWIATVSGGVRSSVVISYPLIILLSGWLLGTRAAIWMAVATIGVALSFAVLEMNRMLPVIHPSHTMMYWLVVVVICGLSATLIAYLLRSQRQQLDMVRELTADLVEQRTLAESAVKLRRGRELLDSTGHLARVGGWAIEATDGALSWTTETYRIHGRNPGNPVSLADFAGCYPPEARATLDDALRNALCDGESFDLELSLDGAYGRRTWVRLKGEAQVEEARVVRVIGAVQDITEQRLAAQAEKESLTNLRSTLEVTEDGIFAYNGRDPSGRLLFANDRFFDIWRIPRDRAPVTGRAEIISAARALFVDPDREVARINEILAMGVLHEDKVQLNDGRVLFRRSIPIAEDTQVTRVWSFRDVTAEELLKDELKASRDEAQRASRAKSTFLANMSHELRTPMNAIIGMTALALRHTDDPRLRNYLSKIDQGSAHLLEVINDILDISKIEAERMTLERVEFRLDSVLDGVAALVGQRARDKGLSLEIDLPADLGAVALLGDPLRLTQILLNLCGNAVKFTEHGGIRIVARLTDRTAIECGVRLAVVDSGIGIAADDRARLFDAFEQADNSMTRKYGGTGLGLAISKRLVDLMGGTIGVDSEPGAGSTFWFSLRLPLQRGDARNDARPQRAAEVELRGRFSGASVLLVEDEPINAEVARDLLEEVGLRVDVATDGTQAHAMARLNRYGVILMDVQMPGMNGIEATRAIRSDSRNIATPIVAMTANAFSDDRAACLAAGMNDHLGKPVAPDVLYRCLLRWLSFGANPT